CKAACLHGVEQSHGRGSRRTAGDMSGPTSEVHRLLVVPEKVRLVTHSSQEPATQRKVTGRTRKAKALVEVSLGQAVFANVVRGPSGEPGQRRSSLEVAAADLGVGVGEPYAGQDRSLKELRDQHFRLTTAVPIVECAEHRVSVPRGL